MVITLVFEGNEMHSGNHVGDGILLSLTTALATAMVSMLPRQNRRELVPGVLIALATCLIILDGGAARREVLKGLVIALGAIVIAVLIRDWPQIETAAGLVLMAGLAFAISFHCYVSAALLVVIGGLSFRIIKWRA